MRHFCLVVSYEQTLKANYCLVFSENNPDFGRYATLCAPNCGRQLFSLLSGAVIDSSWPAALLLAARKSVFSALCEVDLFANKLLFEAPDY